MLLKLAWRNIWRNRRRTLITASSVFLAVVLSATQKGFKEGTYERMMDNMLGSFMGYVQVQSPDFWDDRGIDNSFDYSEELDSIVTNTKGVVAALPRVESFSLAIGKNNRLKISSIVGVDPGRETLVSRLDQKVVKGEYLAQDDRGVLIGKKMADILLLEIGDTLVLSNASGYHGAIGNGLFVIRGMFSMGSPELNKRLVFMTQSRMKEFLSMPDVLTTFMVKTQSAGDAEDVAKALSENLGDSYRVMHWQEMAPELKNMIEGDRVEGYIISGILYLVIAFGIFGTIVMMLAERMHEFGVMVAIGMKRLKLAVLVFMEVLMMSFVGVLAGVLGSYPVLLYFHFNPIQLDEEMSKLYEEMGFEAVIQTSIDPSIMVGQGIVIGVIATVLCLYPFMKLRNIKAIDAMK